MRFAHEGLDVYQLAVEVARWIRKVQFPPDSVGLRDQAVRASQSVVLNIAEGRARKGKAATNHFRIALGSAAEVCSVLDLADVEFGEERQRDLRRIGQMLDRMGRSSRLD